MTLALDTTGLLARYLEGPTHAVAVQAMNSDPDWCASALVLSEAMMLMDRLGLEARPRPTSARRFATTGNGAPWCPSTASVSIGQPNWDGPNRCARWMRSTWRPPTACLAR